MECKLNILLFLDVDLYRLYRVVDRLGGHTRVTNKNLWKQVGRKLGFENTWSTNQVYDFKFLFILWQQPFYINKYFCF